MNDQREGRYGVEQPVEVVRRRARRRRRGRASRASARRLRARSRRPGGARRSRRARARRTPRRASARSPSGAGGVQLDRPVERQEVGVALVDEQPPRALGGREQHAARRQLGEQPLLRRDARDEVGAAARARASASAVPRPIAAIRARRRGEAARELARAVRARDDDPVVAATGRRLVAERLDPDQRAAHDLVAERLETGDERVGLRLRTRDDDPHRCERGELASERRRDRRRCGARATTPSSAAISAVERRAVVVRGDGREAAAADRRDDRALGLDAAPRLLVVGRGDEMLLACAHLERERALRGFRQQLAPGRSGGRSRARARAGRARTPRARSRRARARRACAGACRCCRAAARSRASARARAAAPCGAQTRCRCACPAGPTSAPQSASRGSSRSRYAPTARPSGSVDVMSFAECTATSMRCSSSASSSSFTKTPREPISPNGFERSRSPAVVIGTSAISMPGARRCAAASSACVSASLLPRLPTRISTARPPPDGLPARRDAPRGRTRTNAVGTCNGSGRPVSLPSFSVRPRRDRTGVAPLQHRSPRRPTRPPASCGRSAGAGACSRSAR